MMEILWESGERYVVVNTPHPGIQVYDKVAQMCPGNGAFYDNIRGDGGSGLRDAIEAAVVANLNGILLEFRKAAWANGTESFAQRIREMMGKRNAALAQLDGGRTTPTPGGEG